MFRNCEEQYGFMPGRGTIDTIFALRQLMERHIEVQAELHMAFNDLDKSYDAVQQICRCLRNKHVPEKYVSVVEEDMYQGAMAQVRSSAGATKAFPVRSTISGMCFQSLSDLVMDVRVKDVKESTLEHDVCQ